MNFAIVLQLIGAVTIACGCVGIFDRLDNPKKAQKRTAHLLRTDTRSVATIRGNHKG